MSETKSKTEQIIKQNRVIWDETVRKYDLWKITRKSEVIDAESLQVDVTGSVEVVKVFNNDLLTVVERVCKLGLTPLVVNCGSNNDPVKQVEMGPIGAEWDLMRRSSLGRIIEPEIQYPLRDGKILYVPDVMIFRDARFNFVDPIKVHVLTIPPVRQPALVSSNSVDDYHSTMESSRMKLYVEAIFKIALLRGHKCIIVDDFGCQKNFGNPINTIIRWFNECLERYPVKYCFFAIDYPPLERMNNKKNEVYENYIKFDQDIKR